jgi:hypothetical protein
MLQEDYSCVMCNQGCEETSLHLYFECSFSKECWESIPISWDLNLNPLDMILFFEEVSRGFPLL